jgi:hypothetical protein
MKTQIKSSTAAMLIVLTVAIGGDAVAALTEWQGGAPWGNRLFKFNPTVGKWDEFDTQLNTRIHQFEERSRDEAGNVVTLYDPSRSMWVILNSQAALFRSGDTGTNFTKFLDGKWQSIGGSATPLPPVHFPASESGKHRPLLVMFGGAGDQSGNGPIKNLSAQLRNSYQISGLTVMYYGQTEAHRALIEIRNHVRLYGPHIPVVIVGHSWGGHSAYYVARELGSLTIENNLKRVVISERTGNADRVNVDLLVTLDPVTNPYPNLPPLIGRNDRPSNVRRWVNIYTDSGLYDAVGRWGSESGASQNISTRDSHSKPDRLYRRAEGQVVEALRRMPPPSPPTELFVVLRDGGLIRMLVENVTENPRVTASAEVGHGFRFQHILDGPSDSLLAVDGSHDLYIYPYKRLSSGIDFQPREKIGQGFNFSKLLPASHGRLLAVTHSGDLMLYEYSLRERTRYEFKPPRQIGHGFQVFPTMFTGKQRELYAVAANADLLLYRHDWVFNFEAKQKVGAGWQFKSIDSTLTGTIFALTNDGKILRFPDRRASPVQITQGLDATALVVNKSR